MILGGQLLAQNSEINQNSVNPIFGFEIKNEQSKEKVMSDSLNLINTIDPRDPEWIKSRVKIDLEKEKITGADPELIIKNRLPKKVEQIKN